jgi:hypothetical protein
VIFLFCLSQARVIDAKLRILEEHVSRNRLTSVYMLVQDFEKTRAERHRLAHDNTLADALFFCVGSISSLKNSFLNLNFDLSKTMNTVNFVLLTIEGGIEQVIGCLLERGQHEYALFHFGQAATCYAKHLTLYYVTNKIDYELIG